MWCNSNSKSPRKIQSSKEFFFSTVAKCFLLLKGTTSLRKVPRDNAAYVVIWQYTKRSELNWRVQFGEWRHFGLSSICKELLMGKILVSGFRLELRLRLGATLQKALCKQVKILYSPIIVLTRKSRKATIDLKPDIKDKGAWNCVCVRIYRFHEWSDVTTFPWFWAAYVTLGLQDFQVQIIHIACWALTYTVQTQVTERRYNCYTAIQYKKKKKSIS